MQPLVLVGRGEQPSINGNIFLNSDKKDIVPRLALKMKEINKTILNNYIQKNCNYEMNTNTIYLISHINELIRNNRL